MTYKARIELNSHLSSYFDNSNNQNLTALEAGCGSASRITIPNTFHITGIDISQSQLDRNKTLNTKILGNLESYEFENESFNLIVCWDVLEHLQLPDKVLHSFKNAIRTNGIIILAFPNVLSLKGLLTKFTPYRFHIWVYKHIFGKKNAGVDGRSPFKTYLKYSLSKNSINRFTIEEDLKINFFREYDATVESLKNKNKFLFFIYFLVAYTLKIISIGKLGGINNSDFIFVLQRKNTSL